MVKRYETLDALRGVAALAVVVFHLRAFNILPDVAPHAYLAVDFFFVLSGFVVAHAYGRALETRMTWREFARRRFIRLAPLAVLGALLGLLVLLVKWKMFPERQDPLLIILFAGLLNLLMLPSFFAGNAYEHGMYPGDGPLWSLFFELVVNLVWGGLAAKRARIPIAGVAVAAAVALTGLSIAHGSTRMGVGPETFPGGLARATFGFLLGVLLYGFKDRLPRLPTGWGAAVCGLLLILAFCGPLLFVLTKSQAMAWDLAWIVVILPAVVALGAADESSSRIGRFLGDLSYPVYVLHWPCLAVFSGLRQKVFPTADPVAFSLVAIGLIIIFAWVTSKVYDQNIRALISRRLAPRRYAIP